jgi:hypothetical protein
MQKNQITIYCNADRVKFIWLHDGNSEVWRHEMQLKPGEDFVLEKTLTEGGQNTKTHMVVFEPKQARTLCNLP